MIFEDRTDAGRRLAAALDRFRGEDAVVLGLPRGGVPVAGVVARDLGLPLDVIVVRKLGLPFQPEVAMGAIGEDGVRVVHEDVVRAARVTLRELREVEDAERRELARRVLRFRDGRRQVDLHGRTAIVVDDGLATGATATAACRVARARGAARVVLAVPVGSPRAVEELRHDADEVVCLDAPASFGAVGAFYRDFSATSDAEVSRNLADAEHAEVDLRGAETGPALVRDDDVDLPGPPPLRGRLAVPLGARGVVVFAHGSGSSRHSPRNRLVATVLQRAGFATLLLDLLTPYEERDRANVFDVWTLSARLARAVRWLEEVPEVAGLPVGLFGASTGAAAALMTAAELGPPVVAVVSRGGRPDLAGDALGRMHAPTLLIAGGDDPVVVELNRRALAHLAGEGRLSIVPGAGHLFEEPGALVAVAAEAERWFDAHLGSRPDDGGAAVADGDASGEVTSGPGSARRG